MHTSFAAAAALTTLALLSPPALAQTSGPNASFPGATVLFKNDVAAGAPAVVRIDGREVDHLRMAASDDITKVVPPGSHTLTVTWNGPVRHLHFQVAYAPHGNAFKNVLAVNLDAAADPALGSAGSRSYRFTIPG